MAFSLRESAVFEPEASVIRMSMDRNVMEVHPDAACAKLVKNPEMVLSVLQAHYIKMTG